MPTHDTTHIPEWWKETTLGEVIIVIAMWPFWSNLKVDMFTENWVPIIKWWNLFWLYVSGDYTFVSEDKATSLWRSVAYPWDFVITHRGTLWQVAIVPNNEYPRYVASQSQLRFSVDQNKINNLYLLYFLKSNSGQHELLKNASQVWVPAIATPTKAIKDINLLLPPLLEQVAIADMLSSFDAKIELLRGQNEILEKTAQTIFQEWFGKYSIENPEELPEGWRVGKLGEIASLQWWFVHDTSATGKTQSLIAKMWVVNWKDWFNRSSVMEYSGIPDEKYKLYEDDIIVCTRDVTQDRIIIGNVSIIPKDLSSQWLYAWSNTWILKSEYNKYYLFLVLRSQEFRDHIIQSAKWSTIIMITKDAFLERDIIIPLNEFISELMSIISPIFDKIKSHNSQIQSLSRTRDELLPRLMSGEVRVI